MPTIADGGKTFYFLTVDYAFGHALERDATSVLQANGGTLSSATPNTPMGNTDFSANLLQAQASGAQVLMFANSGQDMENAVKQAREFDLQMRLVPLLMLIMDVQSDGLEAMQGTRFADVFYWDMNERTRAWSKRFFDAEKHMPTALQVDAYRAMLHYLQAIKTLGTTEAKAVVRQMKKDPIKDILGDGGTIREDGRVIRDMGYFEVKTPAESRYPWDYYRLLHTNSGGQHLPPPRRERMPAGEALGFTRYRKRRDVRRQPLARSGPRRSISQTRPSALGRPARLSGLHRPEGRTVPDHFPQIFL